jgi:hypothetical protein
VLTWVIEPLQPPHQQNPNRAISSHYNPVKQFQGLTVYIYQTMANKSISMTFIFTILAAFENTYSGKK